ncbi:solute carrier family 35 member F3-like isoform X1 [Rhopilema esculentum]|uniref:solute carrier family 35 member F3-like isoform X1 n=1 Tax=Rhopilema esculentum TaxID=499914 RepID=UPI0031E36DF0
MTEIAGKEKPEIDLDTKYLAHDLFVHEPTFHDETEKEIKICGMKESVVRIVFGIIIVLVISISWVAATQFAMRTYTSSFSAPYFTTWFTTCFMAIVFPLFSLSQFFKKEPWRFKVFCRDSAKIFGPRGVCLISLIKYTLPFCILWLITNYLYIRALKELNPADVTALFSSVSAFVYIFSIALLKEKFFITRLTAVLMSIGGIVLFASTYGFKGPTAEGIVLTVIAASGSALYQVMFKVVVKTATGSQVALFLSLLGLCNILVFWIVILPFHFTKYESLDSSDFPWVYLIGSGLLILVFNYMVNFGIAFTSPLFIALGTLLGTPLNAATDYIFNRQSFGYLKIIATCLILGGFSLMLIPNNTLRSFERKLVCAKDEIEESEPIEASDKMFEGGKSTSM